MIEIISKKEVWLPVVGYEGLYEVSSFGRVRSICYNKNKILKQLEDINGYVHVDLYKNKTMKHYKVHRLVAQAFLPNWFNEPQINHRDEDKHNNHVNNLEWCSAKYNTNYGTHNKRSSEKKKKPVLQFTKDGEFVAEYNSIKDVDMQFDFDFRNVSACCLNKRKTAYGFIWKYKNI